MTTRASHLATEMDDQINAASTQIPQTLDVSPFIVSDAQEIDASLQSLAASGAVVTLYPPDGTQWILGWLTDAGTPAQCFVFKTDHEVSVPAGMMIFVAEVQGIKLQFSCQWSGSSAPQSALVVACPLSLIKLQRRRFARFNTPVGQPFSAGFGIGRRAMTLTVEDLAMGGVGLRATPQEAAMLYINRNLSRVQLVLGQDVSLVVDMEICSRHAWHSYLLGKQFHVGCRFTGIGPAELTEIQRVLDWLEQDKKKRRSLSTRQSRPAS